MKVRVADKLMNLFRLSKLGQEIDPDGSYFMDSDGNVYEQTSERNKPRRARKLPLYWPALHERAKKHVDWDSDTMEL